MPTRHAAASSTNALHSVSHDQYVEKAPYDETEQRGNRSEKHNVSIAAYEDNAFIMKSALRDKMGHYASSPLCVSDE